MANKNIIEEQNMLDPTICFKARMSRDNRFDGKFYTAVMSTGIFCRPICPARAAKEENVRYFKNAASAQEAGFTPCKRCLPEQAPEQAMPLQAKRMSESLLTTHQSIETIAKQFDLSERQFRRIFSNHYGLAPKQYRQHHSLLLARKLLLTTTLSIADICFASGFTSLRRFNEQVKSVYKLTPSQLRQQQSRATDDNFVNIKLQYRPPFDWQGMLKFFHLRQLPGIEKVTEHSYQRSITFDGKTGWIEITQLPNQFALNLRVMIEDYSLLNKIIVKVRRMFDLDADMSVIHKHLSQDETLAPLVEKFQGIRLPGCWDIFEFSIRAILGQQVSVKAATTLAGRIAEKYGSPLTVVHEQLSYCFPTLEEMTQADFSNIGLTQSRIQTLHTWLDFYQQYPQVFEQYKNLEQLEDTLTALKGIGPWTVNYIAMRGLSDPNAFPAADLGIIKSLYEELKNAAPVDKQNERFKPKTRDIIARADKWQPWRAYATIYLWLSLAAQE
ncbi:DNA-3-methyladenine glycosylase 2 family protein [Thalassotalea atypica]|uniref:DNA-3-methyladenine glycosylase 2 family protein n=1 Tax=Thalassotalea atypica TaxID=2054316 RepID=UPI0025740988|nr:DNA-3-methyladenine glycosylase 2 [Thalassotalea atypica]